jgi:heat shock protein HslJ
VRTHIRTSIAAIFVLALVLSACSDESANESAALRGRTYLSESVSVKNEPKTLVAGTRIRLSFPSDDRITATAGCNILGGTVNVAEDRLSITELGTTEMGCDPARHAQDEWLASVLTAWPAYRIDGTHLVLQTEDTVIQLLNREVAEPDRALVATTWEIDGLVSGTSASSIPAGTYATVIIDANTVRIAIDSCNEGSANIKIGPSTIEVEALVMTDIACADAPTRLESAIAATLKGKVDYSIEAASLRLTRSDGNGLTLKAR